ncbi:MAG: error-prone DNA polymerase [Aquamicrobium sp.]|uniref:error-prone DNA polymerase n=1 Tax=Aquamicrobium sp. TaxID=1872579 RepID=UPI00349EB830|nr:error-prone DNA polymerase [Aquamicrobium sp.]
MSHAELVAASNFSFLRGASHAHDLVAQAIALGCEGIGIADRNTVAGVVRAYSALNQIKEKHREETDGDIPFRLAVGARLVFEDGAPDVVAYPANRDGWGRLCRLLTVGNLRGTKGKCHLTLDDLLDDTSHLLLILMPGDPAACEAPLRRLAARAAGSLWLGATMHRQGADRRRLVKLDAVARRVGVPLLATNDVLYHAPEQRPLQDILACIREGMRIDTAGRRLEVNAERHLKPPEEMARLFRDRPEAVEESRRLLERVGFSLDQLKYDYPDEPVPPGKTPQGHLEDLVRQHAAARYPGGTPAKVAGLLKEELALIAELDYARYFLTIHDIVRYARDKKILCQGRGSAANSVVCFVLGITNVDPEEIDVLFARFLSKERKEPPDIDIDFEHERREEVIQHIYERYGRHRAGIAATVISYRPRSAIREVGKALGLTEDVTSALAATVWGSHGEELPATQVRQAGFDPGNPVIMRAVEFAKQLIGFPRHLSQHVGGFILSRGRLDETVPIGNAAMEARTFIEWDRDDIDELGLLKVDVLALGMLTCIRKAFDLLRQHAGIEPDLATFERNDEAVYDMLCRGDSIGVFQVESRGQINMLPRLKPRCFYDLAIQVAIVRPGPIQGNMVHPYLRRRSGAEDVTFPSPSPEHGLENELHEVLGKTKGVPLFQEQAMRLAMVAAKFTAEEANRLRRAMATFRNLGTIDEFERMMIDRMTARGYDPDFARRCYEQIKGFGSYGFPESHAASFAHLVYVSSWIKCHHPAIFACALLNAQPMGFYAPAQIVRDAREHGVEVRPADVNMSDWDNTIEPTGMLDPATGKERLALRLGLRQIGGIREELAGKLVDNRGTGYPDIETLARRAALPRAMLERLADADAFRSIGLDRRNALWAARRIPDDRPLPLFAAADAAELPQEPDARLPALSLAQHVVTDYQTTRLSLKAHPLVFLRAQYRSEGIRSCGEIAALADKSRTKTAGVVLVRQRPGNGKVVFMTIEDETGIANVVIWASLFQAFRRQVMGSRLIEVQGRVQKSPEGIAHLVAQKLIDRSADLNRLSADDRPDFMAPGIDETLPRQPRGATHPRNVRIIPKSRDFH